MSNLNTFEVLGDRAPIPCSIEEAQGVAMAFMDPGTTLTPLPFKHPPLLSTELRIRVTHSGLCHSDIFFSNQSWFKGGCYPMVTGHEITGVVEKVGSAVVGYSEGDRVGFGCNRDCCNTCNECVLGFDNTCSKKVLTYNPHFGGYATSFQARADFFFKLPDAIPGEAAPLFCAGLTVFAPLTDYTRAGMKVGVVGIGGLGHLGLKFASKMGLEVTAISTSASKEAEARSYGAHHFLNLKDPDQVKNASQSFDFILNTATSFSISNLLSLLKARGQLHISGAPAADENLDFNLFQMIMNNLKLTCNPVGSRKQARDMLDFCALHDVLPVVEVYPFDKAQDALNSLAHGTPHFPKYRAVLETASYFEHFTPQP
jgi:uncharacterized zinc-type alcohol dehydrogenase-like protein